jgi:hypothetical protein
VKIELDAGGLQLAGGQILKVLEGAGRTVCAQRGWVWITEEGHPVDVILEPGECYRLRRRGVAIVNAIGGDAAVALA